MYSQTYVVIQLYLNRAQFEYQQYDKVLGFLLVADRRQMK